MRPFKIRLENIGSDEIESDQIGSGDTRRDRMRLGHITGDWLGSKDILFDLMRLDQITWDLNKLIRWHQTKSKDI